jgi:hypothetical protein
MKQKRAEKVKRYSIALGTRLMKSLRGPGNFVEGEAVVN